jgi:hypothetical protein
MLPNPVMCYKRHRFPAEIIRHAIWLYRRPAQVPPQCRYGIVDRDYNADHGIPDTLTALRFVPS